MDDLTARLSDYYDQEADLGLRTDLGPVRAALRSDFADRLRGDGRASVVDIGAGPGHDTAAFARDGFDVVGIDLATRNVGLMRGAGLRGVTGSLFALPLRPAHFDAVWTMSTLVHVPDSRFDAAMRSIVSVAAAGAPIGVGSWGGFDWEGISDQDTIQPARFFALRAHERFVSMLGEHGAVESFDTYHPNPESRWEYQFAVLRV